MSDLIYELSLNSMIEVDNFYYDQYGRLYLYTQDHFFISIMESLERD